MHICAISASIVPTWIPAYQTEVPALIGNLQIPRVPGSLQDLAPCRIRVSQLCGHRLSPSLDL